MTKLLFHIETLTSEARRVKDVQLRVRSQVVQLRLPIAHGGLIWNRPVAVLVDLPDGQQRVLPIPDPTRTAVLAFTGICIASTILAMFFRHRNA
jgi:hypothetical protein